VEFYRRSKSRQKAIIDAGNAINTFIATLPFVDDDKKRKFRFRTAPKTQSTAE